MRLMASLVSLAGLLVGCAPQVDDSQPDEPVTSTLHASTLTAGCGGCTSTAPSYPSNGCGRDKKKLVEAPVVDGTGRRHGTISHMWSPTCWQVWAEYESIGSTATPPPTGLVRVQVIQANALGMGFGCGCWAQDTGSTLTSPMAAIGYTWAGMDQSRVVGCIDGACGGTTLRTPK